jgi:hypothetical protein
MVWLELHEYAAGQSSSWMGTPEERKGFTGHDLRGAVGEGFGDASPVEWGRPHEVGRGESLFPQKSLHEFRGCNLL